MTIFDDLEAEQQRLAGILGALSEEQWRSPSGAAGWTVADVVLHLAQSEEAVAVSVAGGPAGPGLIPRSAIPNGCGTSPGWHTGRCRMPSPRPAS
jgi:uncharacterized protein (TIGR03083 family)